MNNVRLKTVILCVVLSTVGCGKLDPEQTVTEDGGGVVTPPNQTPLDPGDSTPPAIDPSSGLKNYSTSNGGRFQISQVNVVPVSATQFYSLTTSNDGWAYLLYRRTDSAGISFMTFERKLRTDTSWTRMCSFLDDTRFGKTMSINFPHIYVFDPTYSSGYRIRKINLATCLIEPAVIAIPNLYTTPYFNSSYPYFSADGDDLWLFEYSYVESQRRIRRFSPQSQSFSTSISGTIVSGVAQLGLLRPFAVETNSGSATKKLWSLSNSFVSGASIGGGRQAIYSRDIANNSVRWAPLPYEDYPNLSSGGSSWPGISEARVGFTYSKTTNASGGTEDTPYIVLAVPLNSELHIFWLNVKNF